MLEIVKRTSPSVARWLQAVERDPNVDFALVSMLRGLEEKPDVGKTLVLAKELAAQKEIRLLAMAILLLGRFDHVRVQGFLELVLKHTDPRLRIVAVEACHIGMTRWGLRKCLQAMADRDTGVSSRAAEVYRDWTSEDVQALMRELLAAGDTAAITEAVEGLTRVASTDLLAVMGEAFEKADLSLRRKLTLTLPKIAGPQVLEWAKQLHERQTNPDSRKVLEIVITEMTRLLGTAPVTAVAPPVPPPVAAPRVAPPSGPGQAAPQDLEPALEPDRSSPRPVAAPPESGARPTRRLAVLSLAALEPAQAKEKIQSLLRELVTQGGSDLHIKSGLVPRIRKDGQLVPLDHPALTAAEVSACVASVLNAAQMEIFAAEGDLDLSLGLPGVARFRLNFLVSRGAPSVVARIIPHEVPSIADSNVPQVVSVMAQQTQGLLLVTGPTGSGKSTLLAAMVDLINATRHGHVVTLEDPLEFLHRDKLCTVTQREVGSDVASFEEGLRFAQRMDPDVILVGELRDLETVRAALQAAASGRLILASMRTRSAMQTLERLIGWYPQDEQVQAKAVLARAFVGIVTQALCAQTSGGRVAAHEVLAATPDVQRALRDGELQVVRGRMEAGAAHGMTTLEQSLARLLKASQITREEALFRANDPATLEMMI